MKIDLLISRVFDYKKVVFEITKCLSIYVLCYSLKWFNNLAVVWFLVIMTDVKFVFIV